MPSSGRWKRSTACRVNASHAAQAGGFSRSIRSISSRVGAEELPRADVDEPVLENERLRYPYAPGAGIAVEIPRRRSASLTTSTIASSGTFAASAWRENASACFTFGTITRATTTRPM